MTRTAIRKSLQKPNIRCGTPPPVRRKPRPFRSATSTALSMWLPSRRANPIRLRRRRHRLHLQKNPDRLRPPYDNRKTEIDAQIGSVHRYDDQRTGTATGVKQRHFLNVCNQEEGFLAEKPSGFPSSAPGGEATDLAMQHVHDNNQNTENQKKHQQQPFA